jgi:hypothetical protein
MVSELGSKWRVTQLGREGVEGVVQMHLTPEHDLKEHTIERRCWCRPELDAESQVPFWIHNSLDRRERFEGLPRQ